MPPRDNHIADQELLLEAEGEVSTARATRIREHLAQCQSCRKRKAGLEQTAADFASTHRDYFDRQAPPIDRSRAILRARLSEAAATAEPRAWYPRLEFLWSQHRLAWDGAFVLLLALVGLSAWWPSRHIFHRERAFAPNAAWTPGAVRPLGRDAVCSTAQRPEFRPISASVAQAVFTRYGIRDPRPRYYEVDYLIPPTLGGSDDPLNLWPEPYASGVWNSRVKDALEDRLRSLVCDGKLDLAVAQRDLATDWIAAYKNYFHTDKPLLDHLAFVKDRPWE